LGREQPDSWENQVKQTLRFLLPLFASGSFPGNDVRSILPAPLSAVINHLRREWSHKPLRRVGVDELAATARVSRSYLNRLFQTEFGISPAAGLEGLRCSRAEMLLTRTDMTISSIAHQCGFADLHHFSHRFARRYGVPPSEYRDVGTSPFSVLDHPGVRRLAPALWE
jgi:transcriptional regulator GlxA family with amidase domain